MDHNVRTKPKLAVLVDTPRTGAGNAIAANLIGRGIQVMVLIRDFGVPPPHIIENYRQLGVTLAPCDTNDVQEVIRKCTEMAETHALVAIGSAFEFTIEVAAQVARHFHLPGPAPDAIRLCRAKQLTRVALADEPGLNPASKLVNTVDEALAAGAEIGYPVVAKPTGLSGSAYVKLCAGPEDLTAQSAAILGLDTFLGRDLDTVMLIEEFLDGEEYSVEILSGHILGVTRKFLGALPYFYEVGHLFPADIPPAVAAQVADVARRAVKRVGLEWGAAHVEVKFGTHGPRIIEINPRLAGDRIPDLIRLATGIDMIDLFVGALLGETLSVPAPDSKFASIRFLPTATGGTLEQLKGVPAAQAIPHVVEVNMYIKPGMQHHYLGSNHDRVGHVITCAETAGAAMHNANAAVEAIDVIWA